MSNAVINSIGFEAFLQARDAIAERVAKAHSLLREAQEIATHNDMGWVCRKSEFEFMPLKVFLTPDGADAAMKHTDRCAWELLLKRSNVMDLMSAKRKQEWRTALIKGEAPQFTQDAIVGTFKSLYESRGDVFETSVVECFEQLYPCYQSNGLTGFTRRIVLSQVTDVYAGGLPGHSSCDQVDDLLRFMHLMDQQPIPHANKVRSAILSALPQGKTGAYEDEYLHLRWFKNGNGHLTFKRLDLIEALNQMIAKHRANTLPEPRNARFKSYA